MKITTKRCVLTFIVILGISLSIYSQTQSDISASEGGYGMVRTNLNLQYEHSWGEISDTFGARVSYECLKTQWLTLSANGKYNSYTVGFASNTLTEGYDPSEIELNKTHLMGQIGFTSTAKTRLFGKPLMGLAILNSDWSAGGFERISATIMGLIMLKANRSTQFGLGPLVMINTSSKIPAFLVFMYCHRLNKKWRLNLYGAMLGADYTPTPKDLLSLGADIDVKAFYFKPYKENLPERCRFTCTSFRPMLKYRRQLASNFYFEAKGGVAIRMSCRVNGKTGTNEYFKCTQKIAPFLQSSFSYSL